MGTDINKLLPIVTSIAKNAFLLNEHFPQKLSGDREFQEVEAVVTQGPPMRPPPVFPDSCPLAAMDVTERTGRYRGVGKTGL